MVSIRRRRKLDGLCTGSSSLVPDIPDVDIPEKTSKLVDANHIPSVALNLEVEVIEEQGILANPPLKKQKVHAQIDPDNPIEVHAYLMQLREDNKLDLGPMQRNGEMPVKEWMEKSFPHIFRVFPQNPKVFFQFADKSMQNELLYSHYWLFLFEVRNIVMMDYRASPEYVTSLGKVIENLENQGFDCRFLRSELLVVGNMMKQRQQITLAEKKVIATRTLDLEKELQAVVRREKKAEMDDRGKQIIETKPQTQRLPNQLNDSQEEDQCNDEVEVSNFPCSDLDKGYFDLILERHKRMLASKEEEGKRIDRVLENLKLLIWRKATAFSGL